MKTKGKKFKSSIFNDEIKEEKYTYFMQAFFIDIFYVAFSIIKVIVYKQVDFFPPTVRFFTTKLEPSEGTVTNILCSGRSYETLWV